MSLKKEMRSLPLAASVFIAREDPQIWKII